MKWLITGGCGFIGSNLVSHLVRERRHKIIVVDNQTVGQRSNLEAVAAVTDLDVRKVGALHSHIGDGVVGLVAADILDADLALTASAGVDVIVHLAANTGVQPSLQDPRRDLETNVVGTFNYLQAARHNSVSRFVFASSGAPVGSVEPPIHEELAPHPISPYGASKLAGEGYCSAFAHSFGVETVALRFGNVYGPGSAHKRSVIANFFQRILRGETLEIYGDGLQTRDFIFVDDLTDAVVRSVLAEGVGGETFQIATQSETSVRELLDQMRTVVEEAGVVWPGVTYAEPLMGDVRRNFSDTSKAGRMLGWQARVALREGLRRTLAYWQSVA